MQFYKSLYAISGQLPGLVWKKENFFTFFSFSWIHLLYLTLLYSAVGLKVCLCLSLGDEGSLTQNYLQTHAHVPTHPHITHTRHNTINTITHLNVHSCTCMHTHNHKRTHIHTQYTHTKPTQASISPSFSAATVNVKQHRYG